MIDRKLTRADLYVEVLRRILARVDLTEVTPAELDAVTRQVSDEIEAEIQAYWAARELELRRELGERLQ